MHSANKCKLCSTADEQRSSLAPLFTDIADNDVQRFMKRVILMGPVGVHNPQAISDEAEITSPALSTYHISTPSPTVAVSPSKSQTGATAKEIMKRTVFAPCLFYVTTRIISAILGQEDMVIHLPLPPCSILSVCIFVHNEYSSIL